MILHLKQFVLYYVSTRQVEIASRYDRPQSLSRLLRLNDQGEIRITTKKNDHLIAVGSQWGGRSNVLPVFEGVLEEQSGLVKLRGHIGIDPGIRLVLGMFVFFVCIFFHLPLGRPQAPATLASYVGGPLALFGLLGFGYFLGKDDANKIIRNLSQALSANEST